MISFTLLYNNTDGPTNPNPKHDLMINVETVSISPILQDLNYVFGQFLRPITNHLVVVWDASRVDELCGTGLVGIFWHVKILKGTVVGPRVLYM
jgi:hypothetical protein